MEAQLEMVMDGTMLPPWLLHLDSGKVEIIFVYYVINQVDFFVIFIVGINFKTLIDIYERESIYI